jgi:aspartyl-tRNA(Asn)/glutamyl-tRNA(Gln) amidotransferase subunit C
MTSALRREDVAHVAKLARLNLSDAELERFTDQLGQVLEHANDMSSLDLENVEPTSHPFGLVNVVREDIVRASLERDEVLAMAPDARDGRFAVPRIMGEAP